MSNFYCFTSLIGGGAGALDARDGADLSDGDAAVVITDGVSYFYRLDDHSGPEEEDSPLVIAPDANAGDKRWILTNPDLDLRYPTRVEWLQNGFPNRDDSSISFNDGTRRFTINPSSSSFDYFIAGVKYTVSSSDVENVNYVDIADTEGSWWIYYDGSTLTATVTPNHDTIHDIFENKAVVAIVFWDADNTKGQLLEERHGISMPPITHVFIHETVGTRFAVGLALNSITADENGNTNSHAQFGVDAGQVFDEDIEHTLNAIGSGTGLQIWYRDTSGWTFTTNAGYSMVTTGTGRLAYDNSGSLAEVGDGDFVLCHVFATNMTHLNPVVAIGQAQYATKKLAQQGALTEIVNILAIANISPELKPIASVIFQTKSTYSNAVKARIVSTDEGDDYVDFRTDALNPAFSSAQNHGNLAGLSNDDHTQYLLADGTRAAAFTDLTDVAEGSIDSADIGKVVKVSAGLELEFVDEDILDTDATAAELDELTDSSETTLHSHAGAAMFGRPIILLPRAGCGPAANFATHDTIAGGSTPAEVVSVLDFDPDASEYQDFKFALPDGYAGGGLTVTVIFSMTSDHDEGAHEVRWEVGFARIDNDGIAISADHAYAFNGVSAAVPSVVSEVSYDDITFTDGADMDSLAAGEMAILRIYRDHDHGDDNATGDAELHMIMIKETP